MNEEVKNEATEEPIPVIKYENAEGNEVEIPESDLSDAERDLVNDLKNIHEALRSHDETHKQGLLRQSLTLNINFHLYPSSIVTISEPVPCGLVVDSPPLLL